MLLSKQQHDRHFSPGNTALLHQTTSCPCNFTGQVIPMDMRIRNLEDTFLSLEGGGGGEEMEKENIIFFLQKEHHERIIT